MRNRERFNSTLNFKCADDRLPMIEWAGWWDKTLERWYGEGLPGDLQPDEVREYLGLDMMRQFWLSPQKSTFPKVESEHGIVKNDEDYERIKEHLFPEEIPDEINNNLFKYKNLHDNGKMVIWITLEGFFWFPRTLFGIENHFYAFYDYPELMHRMNQDLAKFNIRIVEQFCKIVKPDFMTFAEDMSYNHGPMLSHSLFAEFLKPYYKQVIPVLNDFNIIPLVDTDGNVEEMIPWLQEAGIEGVLPLERKAGVDVLHIRERFPDFKMIGGYDKTVMSKGEAEMRSEFERLLPVMRSGGFIPSCDHQTPPDVSLENYKLYLKLMKEYCEKACREESGEKEI